MLLKVNKFIYFSRRWYSNLKHFRNSSKEIRKEFLDYFINQNGHTYVKSSSVYPYCDPSLQFVNAGMNQFKGVFLGYCDPPADKVANSQKCVRVGGKHNDLDIVGKDGTHHTFFEMLGSWSFGAYFKKEACELAWELLTKSYGLDPSMLYVTYFEGDTLLNLEPDLETADIWRKIGIPKDHVMACGLSDNFWEMGLTGPCGPCTEIHIKYPNNAGMQQLIELWNIVFIEYNRELDGSIKKLPQKFVDTGLGLERLTAILQGKLSNYETDLFLPLFKTMCNVSKIKTEYGGRYGGNDKTGLDTAYRTIADHARMATVCLADGIVPEENYKLRKIIRRAVILGERYFQKDRNFFWEVCKSVINNLGDIYPELERNKNQVRNIISYEEEVLKALRVDYSPEWIEILYKNPNLNSVNSAEIPNLVLGYKEILKLKNENKLTDKIPADAVFKLYDTYGLDKEKIFEIAHIFNTTIDLSGFNEKLKETRLKSKSKHKIHTELQSSEILNLLQCNSIEKTLDEDKYNYFVNNESNYEFKSTISTLTAIIKNNSLVSETKDDGEYSLVFDKTCFYCEAGGQESDKGEIIFNGNIVFKITDISNLNGYILHTGYFIPPKSTVKVNEIAEMKIEPSHRLENMRNHSATHILNAVIRTILKDSTVFQKSSRVSADELKLNLFIFGNKLSPEKIKHIESTVVKVINNKVPVETNIINERDLLESDAVLIPGEIYPSTGIRLVQILSDDFRSIEPCCGTHVRNTSHIQDFCITYLKQIGRAAYSIKAVTGSRASQIRQNGHQIEKSVRRLVSEYEKDLKSIDSIQQELKALSKKISNSTAHNALPHVVQYNCTKDLNNLKNLLKLSERQSFTEIIDMEMKSSLNEISENGQPWLVHYLRSSSIVPSVSLSKATRVCAHLPVIVLAYFDGTVKARCCVPVNMVSDDFNAEKWMKSTISVIFPGKISAPKGQNSLYVCNMKECKINRDQWDTLLQKAVELANKYAKEHLQIQKNKHFTSM